MPVPKARRTRRRIACGRTARLPGGYTEGGEMMGKADGFLNLATSPIGRRVVISITFVAVPAWLNCRF